MTKETIPSDTIPSFPAPDAAKYYGYIFVKLARPLQVLQGSGFITGVTYSKKSTIVQLHGDFGTARWDYAKNLVLDPLVSNLGSNIKYFYDSPGGCVSEVMRFSVGDRGTGASGLSVLLDAMKDPEPKTANPGYHLAQIEKGVLGEVSKIREELEELEDALAQGSKVMALHELSDMLGAIEAVLEKQMAPFKLEDLIKMKDLTKRAFQSGRRK